MVFIGYVQPQLAAAGCTWDGLKWFSGRWSLFQFSQCWLLAATGRNCERLDATGHSAGRDWALGWMRLGARLDATGRD
ncbi:hypothetical protein CRG98_044788 [Punica granatum]|uniref:Uncharacterized protein n=1 Tax=Punica granatum TaxID=22663 RepID=A0A2I0HSZ1_PUNGR|nr:hypothetical protein CRG98_044788 [Punica granatum]